MKKKPLDRREFLKLEAPALAPAAGGLPAPLAAQNLVTDRSITELKWNKAPCRFCGTGCGVMVATKERRVVATHGDTQAEVNRGLNCVKGYFLSKIMYGHDRLMHPLLRKKNGKYDKNGEFTQVSWDEAFDVMAQQFKAALAKGGPTTGRMFGSGQWTIWEGYAANKLFKAGFRSNNLDPNARHCMASAVMGFMRTFGMDEPMGWCDPFGQGRAEGGFRRLPGRRRIRAVGIEHGGDASDPLEPGHRPPSERTARACGSSVAIRACVVRTRRCRDRVHATDRSRDPERDRQLHHHDEPGEQGFRQKAYGLQARTNGHRIRFATGEPAGEKSRRAIQSQRSERHHV